MNPRLEQLQNLTRRHFLGKGAHGLGALALGSLLRESLSGSTPSPAVVDPLAPRAPHYAPKAKRVIYLHLTGSPPHLDLYDYKPELVKRNGQDCPDAFLKGKRFAFTSGVPKLLGTPRKVAQHGKGGVWLSDAIPHLHSVADELCVIKSMTTDQFNHAPAELLVYTGSPRPGRPSIGSWVTYGLGTENQNLPGFVVLISSGVQPNGGRNSFGSGFLPSVYQGVQCRSKGDPVLYAYGAKPGESSFANNCLLARRLVEQGVRYVQLFDWGWDFHGTGPSEDIRDGLTKKCATMDRPVAALLKDLRQRGMLDETLVVLGGEFGRTPFREGRTGKGDILGRDHFPDCYSMVVAGGGVRGGMMYGESDELGFSPAENKVNVHDLQATLMHQLGFNHERLTYRFQGRDYRLTDIHGEIIRGILT